MAWSIIQKKALVQGLTSVAKAFVSGAAASKAKKQEQKDTEILTQRGGTLSGTKSGCNSCGGK